MLFVCVYCTDPAACILCVWWFLWTDRETGAGHPSPPPGGAAAGGILRQVHLRATCQFLHHRGHEAGWSLVSPVIYGDLFFTLI